MLQVTVEIQGCVQRSRGGEQGAFLPGSTVSFMVVEVSSLSSVPFKFSLLRESC